MRAPPARRRMVSADKAARSARLSTIRYSSVTVNLAAAHAHRVDHRHAAGGDIVAVAHPARRLASRSSGQGRRRPGGRARTGARPRRSIGLGGRAKPPWTSISTSWSAATIATAASISAWRARLVVERRRAHVDAQDGEVGDDIVGAAAVDPRRIDRQGSDPWPRPAEARGRPRRAGRCARPRDCARHGPIGRDDEA